MTLDANNVPDWLLKNPRMVRKTGVSMAVDIGIGPVYDHTNHREGWFAFLSVGSLTEYPWECSHVHAYEDSAWDCAERYLEAFILGNPRRPWLERKYRD